MKVRLFAIITTAIMLYSCNNIPNKSVFEPLDTKDLADIIKKDTLFIPFYEEIQNNVKNFNEIEKAKFNDITYRNLYGMIEFARDTNKINPLRKQWETEWKIKYGPYESKVDSVINYWRQYKTENSLDRFVKIEFAAIDKDYYSYSNDIKNVNFGFRLIPLSGKVEQIRFNYRYTAKINNVQYAEKHNCISTEPFSVPVTRYWEVSYTDEKRLKYVTSAEFRRDYDILFEITEQRKDGVNYRSDDLKIPVSVEDLLDTDSIKYPFIYRYNKKKVITDLILPDYKEMYDYMGEQLKQVVKQKFPREVEFTVYVNDRN